LVDNQRRWGADARKRRIGTNIALELFATAVFALHLDINLSCKLDTTTHRRRVVSARLVLLKRGGALP